MPARSCALSLSWGEQGHILDIFILASLAVHSVTEGLAVAIVLLPWNVSKPMLAFWCVITLLLQALMAVPAFLFVNSFLTLLPVGLGFVGVRLHLICDPVTNVAVRPRDGASVLVWVPVLREVQGSSCAASRPLARQSYSGAAPARQLCH